MTQVFRTPSAVELLLQVSLLLLLLLFGYDLVTALGAQSCSASTSDANCFPWGAEATSGIWYYASKETYILSDALQMAVLLVALAQPLLAKTTKRGLTRTLAVAAIGSGFLQALAFIL